MNADASELKAMASGARAGLRDTENISVKSDIDCVWMAGSQVQVLAAP